MTKTGNIFIISGPSGVGKGTLVKALLAKHPEIPLSISATTRMPRPGEINGKSYFFITKDEFKEKIKNDEFLEWADVFGNYYGTMNKSVKDILTQGKDLILEIDVKGAMQIKNKIKEAVLIFISPPSFEELKHRLVNRHTEPLDVIEKRLSTAKSEMDQAFIFDYNVVNDDINEALKKLEEIIIQKRSAQ